MMVTVDGVIKAAALAGALGVLYKMWTKIAAFVERQNAQDVDLKAIQAELALITYAQLACLKGLKEQGCNGPVTEALNRLEKHLNQAAHHQEEQQKGA